VQKNTYQKYDWRLRNLIANSGNPGHATGLDIPRTTINEWIKNGPVNVVTLPSLQMSNDQLINENVLLRKKLRHIEAETELVSITTKMFGFSLQYQKLPRGFEKSILVKAIEKASDVLSLKYCLGKIGMSTARFRYWQKLGAGCHLKNESSCPKLIPNRLTAQEIFTIKDLVTSQRYAHYSISSLALLAKRMGLVYASTATWSRIIKMFNLRRNRHRVYPLKPKVGIRATRPNELWHIDLSVFKLRDGTKIYIQAIVDNYSRFIMSWRVSMEYGGRETRKLIGEATKRALDLRGHRPGFLMMDSGTENLNRKVDKLLEKESIKKIIAQIDVRFSNSMIESVFHRLKNRHLYYQKLDSFDEVKEAVNSYLSEVNEEIPMEVLSGATPIEAFNETWKPTEIEKMRVAHNQARKDRIETNRQVRCLPCLS
jgi:transposase InsO family protein